MLEDRKDCADQAQGMARHSYRLAPFYMQPVPFIPLASIFSCLFIPKPPRPIPFPTFCSSPKHPLVSLVQSPNALALDPTVFSVPLGSTLLRL